MNESCPISHNIVNSRIIRLVAFQVLVLGLLYLLSGYGIFVYILLFDFVIRFFRIKNFSPLLCFANLASHVMGIKPRMCDEAPKRFALILGMGMLAAIVSLNLLSLVFAAKILMFVLVAFASMEAFFDFCIGCKIYRYVSLMM